MDVLATSPPPTPPHCPTPLGPLAGPREGKAGGAPRLKGQGLVFHPDAVCFQPAWQGPLPSPVICNISRHGSTSPPPRPVPQQRASHFQRQNYLWPKQTTARAVGDAYGFIVTSCSETGPCEHGARPQLHSGCLRHREAGVAAGLRSGAAAGCCSIFQKTGERQQIPAVACSWLVLCPPAASVGKESDPGRAARRRERRAATASGVLPEPEGRGVWGPWSQQPSPAPRLLRP